MKPNQDKHKGNHTQIFHNQLLKAEDKILKAREEMIHYKDVNNDTTVKDIFFSYITMEARRQQNGMSKIQEEKEFS